MAGPSHMVALIFSAGGSGSPSYVPYRRTAAHPRGHWRVKFNVYPLWPIADTAGFSKDEHTMYFHQHTAEMCDLLTKEDCLLAVPACNFVELESFQCSRRRR